MRIIFFLLYLSCFFVGSHQQHLCAQVSPTYELYSQNVQAATMMFDTIAQPSRRLLLPLDSLVLDTIAVKKAFEATPDFSVDTLLVHRKSYFSHLSPTLQIGIPVGLTALGAWGVVDRGWFHKRRMAIRKQFLRWHTSGPMRADDYIQYSGFTAFLTLGFYPGVYHRHNFRDRLLLAATTYAIMGVLVNATKYTVGSTRPDGSARNSFPSGHTATAVMGAELVRTEYGNIVGLGAYAVAATVGVLRMYNNRHWVNDVLGGAAFGFASVRLGLLLLPLEKKFLGWNRPKKTLRSSLLSFTSSIFVTPTFDISQRAPGFSAVLTF